VRAKFKQPWRFAGSPGAEALRTNLWPTKALFSRAIAVLGVPPNQRQLELKDDDNSRPAVW